MSLFSGLSTLTDLIPGVGGIKIAAMAIGALGCAAGGFYVAWHWQAANVARERLRYEQYVAGVSKEAAQQAATNLLQQKAWDAATAAADAKYQTLKVQSDAQIADLSSAVANGTQRLYLPAAATDGANGVPRAAATPGRAHGPARPRAVSWHAIDRATSARLVAIAAAGQRCIAQLTALQGWVRSVVK